jgi:L-ascorbate metabolism protein UlaG (beta-lactamase superfamily)
MAARITWIGHATALIELDGVRLLTDPVIRKRCGPLVRLVRPVDPANTRDIDAVFVSHLHSDHADVPSLRQLGRDQLLVVPRGAGDWLRGRGFTNVTELPSGSTMTIGPLTMTAVPTEHDGRRKPLGPTAESIGFVVRGSHAVYFAGDTDLFPDMGEALPEVDAALLPVGGWGKGLGPGHLDPERAAQAAGEIRPHVAIPIHWGTLGLPHASRTKLPHGDAGELFAERAAVLAPGVEVRVLAPGEHTTLP